MKLQERFEKRTPKFFRVLRNVGLALTAAGGALLAAPVALPAALVSVAGYVTVAGTVATVVSQAVVKDEDDEDFPTPGMDASSPNPLLDPNQ